MRGLAFVCHQCRQMLQADGIEDGERRQVTCSWCGLDYVLYQVPEAPGHFVAERLEASV